MDKQLLQKVGIDTDDAIQRFMDRAALFEKFLMKFLNDTNMSALQKAIAEHQEEQATFHAHTLKGVCGNLSIRPLYDLFQRQVDLFRQHKWEEAVALMPEIESIYQQTINAIKQSCEG